MLAIAGKTAGPIWLNFFREPMDNLWVTKVFAFSKTFSFNVHLFKIQFFILKIPRATPGISAS